MIVQSLLLHFVISVFVLTIIFNYYILSATHLARQINRSVFYNFKTNLNLSKVHIRRKRFLIFEGAGVLKLVLGFSKPVNLLDKEPFRQLAVNYAFHLQYSPPTVPAYWWSYFYNSTAWSNMRDIKVEKRHTKSTKNMKYTYYINQDPYLNLHKKIVQSENLQPVILSDRSRIAVYKAIEIIFQRPSVENIHEKFMRAKKLGSQGTTCKKIYWSCEDGIKWFHNIIKYIVTN